MDVTDAVRWTVSARAPFRLDVRGAVDAVSAGSGTVTARYGGRELQIPVTVLGTGSLTAPAPSFVRDVLPVLSQSGCSAGACHAKPEGQNGFKLSVFSYDPKADYLEIIQEARGRRIFPAAPDESRRRHARQSAQADDDVLEPIENDQRERAPAPEQNAEHRNKVKSDCRQHRPAFRHVQGNFRPVHALSFAAGACGRANLSKLL